MFISGLNAIIVVVEPIDSKLEATINYFLNKPEEDSTILLGKRTLAILGKTGRMRRSKDKDLAIL